MVLRANTRVVVSFHSFPDNGFGGGRRGSRLAGAFRVLGFDTTKMFGEPAGNFTLSIKPDIDNPDTLPSLLDLWAEPEGVWMMVWAQINGQLFDVMLGNIDTITEEMTRSEDGSRSVFFNISGRDHGKVFSETELFINIHERSGALPSTVIYQALSEEVQFTPAQIVQTLIREWVGNSEMADTQWQLPPSLYGGQPFYQALNRSTIDPNTRGNAQELTILQPDQQGQKLWDALNQYCNPVLNELWTDLAPDPAGFGEIETPTDPVTGRDLPNISVRNLRPSVYLRERPFISSEFGHLKWDRLPTHELRPGQYNSTSFAKGNSAERFNFWELVGSSAQTQSINFIARVREYQDSLVAGTGQVGDPGTVPIYNLTSIRRYGLRRFQQSSRFFPINDVSIGELVTGMIPRWLRLLHDWYAPAPREITGTIRTSYLMPWIRIGHRVRLRRRNGGDITFYVEGVSHSYSYPNNGITTVTVTRGEGELDEFLHDIYEEIRDSRSTDDLEARIPGGSLSLSAGQARALREVDQTIASFPDGESSALVDPTTAVDEQGSPIGGERAIEALSNERAQGDSQTADPSMNFADTAPRQSPNAQGVEGIDDENNAPPEPTESADPLQTTTDPAGQTQPVDEELAVYSAGASIPELDD